MATYANSLPPERSSGATLHQQTARPAELPWAVIAWFGALLLVCYFPVLKALVSLWIDDQDMGHGFFVIPIAAYIAWRRREELKAAPASTSYLGLAVVIVGALVMLVGTLGAQAFIARVAFILSLAGAVLFLGGMPVMRLLWFPLILLFFMIPIPATIYAQITLPLQLFASNVAEHLLGLVGIPVLRDGNVLELASQRLSVIEACSGIRSLLSLTFLSLVYGYFFDNKQWMRWVLLVATIPIAIAANAFRVALTGLISEYRVDLAQGVFHELEGWVLFMLDLVLLVVVHALINRVYYGSQSKQEPMANAPA